MSFTQPVFMTVITLFLASPTCQMSYTDPFLDGYGKGVGSGTINWKTIIENTVSTFKDEKLLPELLQMTSGKRQPNNSTFETHSQVLDLFKGDGILFNIIKDIMERPGGVSVLRNGTSVDSLLDKIGQAFRILPNALYGRNRTEPTDTTSSTVSGLIPMILRKFLFAIPVTFQKIYSRNESLTLWEGQCEQQLHQLVKETYRNLSDAFTIPGIFEEVIGTLEDDIVQGVCKFVTPAFVFMHLVGESASIRNGSIAWSSVVPEFEQAMAAQTRNNGTVSRQCTEDIAFQIGTLLEFKMDSWATKSE